MTGNAISLVAIPWFVLQTTGSPTKTGITGAMNFLPIVLASFFGGAFVDRLGARRASIVADLASAIPVAAIPLLHSTVGLEFWQLLVLVFLGGVLDAPGNTARAALLPEAAEEAGWRIERATGAYAVVERGARLVGAPLAGLFIALTGPGDVLWINAASFVVSAGIIYLLGPRPESSEDAEESGAYLQQLKDGLRFLRSDRLIATMIATVTVTNLIDAAAGIVLPVYADRVYGSALSLGLILGAMAGGSVLGALAYSAFGHRVSRRLAFGIGFIVFSLWHLLFAAFPPLPLALVIMAIAGFGAGPINPVIDTIAYERVPRSMRGRVFGVMMSAAWLAVPAGAMLGGIMAAALGLRSTLLILGGAYLITTVLVFFAPSGREMDTPPSTSPPSVAPRMGPPPPPPPPPPATRVMSE